MQPRDSRPDTASSGNKAGPRSHEDAGQPSLAIHPPVHVATHPDEPIRTTAAAAKFVRRHVEGVVDPGADTLVAKLEAAATPQEADAAGMAFKDWAESEGLLLVPPEDHSGRA